MLPRKRRVSTQLFNTILKSGARIHSAHFSLVYARYSPTLPTRAAVAVPKKVEAIAARRNALKRKVMVVVEKNIDAINPGMALIVFAKAGSSIIPREEREAEVQGLIKRSA